MIMTYILVSGAEVIDAVVDEGAGSAPVVENPQNVVAVYLGHVGAEDALYHIFVRHAFW